uniref:Uncharacterized protein n=1 Tax=Vibrio parahaemolyticus TaxID=670 RepID=A0A1Y1BAW4_VIBPH|nr:hypothetical protein [Vibrio parahaemolyticus]
MIYHNKNGAKCAPFKSVVLLEESLQTHQSQLQDSFIKDFVFTPF